MRRIRYAVAMSLDGYIADPDGGYDWIPMDPDIDFEAYVAKIDTYVMGRGTYETTRANAEGAAIFGGMSVYVVSTTLDPEEHPDVTVISDDVVATIAALKDEPGKDIWLFGGGVLFRSLLEAGLVDRVEVGVVPVLLGAGIPVLPGLDGVAGRDGSAGPDDVAEVHGTTKPHDTAKPHGAAKLELHSVERFGSGIVLLEYDVAPG